jgi:hypothetical protein
VKPKRNTDWTELFDEWVHIKTKDGKSFIGMLDDEEEGYIFLQFTKILIGKKWIPINEYWKKLGCDTSGDILSEIELKKSQISELNLIPEKAVQKTDTCLVCNAKIDSGLFCSENCNKVYRLLHDRSSLQ